MNFPINNKSNKNQCIQRFNQILGKFGAHYELSNHGDACACPFPIDAFNLLDAKLWIDFVNIHCAYNELSQCIIICVRWSIIRVLDLFFLIVKTQRMFSCPTVKSLLFHHTYFAETNTRWLTNIVKHRRDYIFIKNFRSTTKVCNKCRSYQSIQQYFVE